MNNLDQQLKVLSQLKVNTAQDALKVIPLVVQIINQVQTVLLRSSRNDVFNRSREIVEQRIKDGSMKPTQLNKGGEEVEPEEALPVEEPRDSNPFEDEQVDEATKEAVKSEILEVELNSKKDIKKLKKTKKE